MNRPVETFVYCEPSKLEEDAGKEFNTGISNLLEE